MTSNYYNVLRLPMDASAEEIRAAYFDAARKYHPDVNPDEGANHQFIEIQVAYDLLSNPSRRKAYDDTLPSNIRGKPPVNLSLLTSESSVRPMDEEQLFYVLVDLSSDVSLDDIDLPSVHICLVIDHSNSMRGSRLEMVNANIRHLVQKLHPNDLVSIVSFSDRAEIVVPPTEAANPHIFESALTLIKAGGGTEIYQGLKSGVELLKSSNLDDSYKQLVLITDGHTYGDEADCEKLAEEARMEGVAINALGIGNEWNDAFLDRLASSSGGNAEYVRSFEDLYRFIENKIKNILGSCARQGKLFINSGEGVELSYAFRIQPDSTPLEIISPLPLGNLEYGKKTSLILEFKIGPTRETGKALKIFDGKILMDFPSWPIRMIRFGLDVTCPWNNFQPVSRPPQAILQAMSKLSLYRLQEKAKEDVARGDVRKATMRLQSLATHLLAQGNRDLAKSVLMESEYILQTHGYSKEGDKNIKYGTRSLFLLPGADQGS